MLAAIDVKLMWWSGSMVVRAMLDGQRLTISLKPGAVSLLVGTDEILTYDRGGRLWLALRHGITYRRGLDGQVQAKWYEHGVRQRRRLPPDEAAALVQTCSTRLAGLLEQIESTPGIWPEPPPAGLTEALGRAARFDAAAAATDAAAFARVYDPVGILPPDQYIALVLQATRGCSFNTCTFCDFYKGQRFRIKSPDEFRAHTRAIVALLGDSLSLRTSIFLGEANALAAPIERLVALLEVARAEVGAWPIHAFQDGFSGHHKTPDDYRRLHALGLRRVSIGMESGHDPLLQFVRKPSTAEDVALSVAALKQAGVAVSLIILVGLGGDQYAAGHVADTITLLNRLPLDQHDLVYFSDLVEHPGTTYPALARAAGIRALSPAELRQQRATIQAALRPGPRIATYDIEEFIY